MRNFLAITGNAFRESLREPVYYILLATALIIIGNFPAAALFSFREQVKLVIDSSLATTLTFGLMAAVLCSSHTVSREMRNGTILLLFSKPVHRWIFIVGKIVGITGAVMLFVYILNVASLISIYIAVDQFNFDMFVYVMLFFTAIVGALIGMTCNFVFGRSFAASTVFSTAILMTAMLVVCALSKNLEISVDIGNVIYAMIVLFFAASVMTTISVVFATKFDAIPNLMLSFTVFLVGLFGNFLFLRDSSNAVWNFILKILYAISPNWQCFWLADAIAANKAIPLNYLFLTGGYALLYMILCTVWAIFNFRNSELAGVSR